MLRKQDEEIKDLKLRLEKVEDAKEASCVDLQKLNHNVNTQINLELLTQSQEPESKGFFGAQHYNTVKKSLPDLKDFYENREWQLLTNLGFMQVYTKPAENEKGIHILARSEINHKARDIGNEIYKQNIFIDEDPNVIKTENIQQVGDKINVYYTQFKKFLIGEETDCVYLSQQISNPPESEDQTIVFPIVSINHYKKKATDDQERLNFKIGGWVLKPLGEHKTLVNVFMNVEFAKSEIPEPILSKHAKSLIAMLRTLESL